MHDPTISLKAASPLQSFWAGGFEGADHINGSGIALDMACATGHLQRIAEDHRRAAQAGLGCVRESIGWRLAEAPGGAIDLTRARAIAASAERHGLQVLWTLMHYGLPADLSLHDDALIDRFARFAAAVARELGALGSRAPVYTPINEISFLAWAASHPGMLRAPNNTPAGDDQHTRDRGYAAKRRLVRAALAGMDAIRAVDPRARFLHAEPLVHVVARTPADAAFAAEVRSWQWQALDMLSGRSEPALGGHAGGIDMLGVNHYHNSQWELGGATLWWHLRDPRRVPFSALLGETWTRYRKPLVVAETSHVGAGRADWLGEICAEVRSARDDGVPVHGVCLYPLVDRPDWDEPGRWHRSGVWHVAAPQVMSSHGMSPQVMLPQVMSPRAAAHDGAALQRLPADGVLQALRQWQRVLPHAPRRAAGADTAPPLLAFVAQRWGDARQRTQQLLTQLARHGRVVVVEPARHGGAAPARLDCIAHGPQLDVLVPYLPIDAPGFGLAQQAVLQSLLQPWLAAAGIVRPLVWLATPLAAALAHSVAPRLLVYDLADAAAAPAPAEAALLASADLVLAAGPSLAAARRGAAGPRLRLLPNGVDAAHFNPRRSPRGCWADAEAQLLQGALPVPRLGFAGCVDRRIDWALLRALALARPQWQLVLAGPLDDALDPAALPRLPNLHRLGAQPPDVVVSLMAGWNVGLLPFALPTSARSNPSEALELLAAGLPVVAPLLPDLRRLQRAGVALAADSAAFIKACDTALAESAPAALQRRRAARRVVAASGWRGTTDTLLGWLRDLLAQRAAADAAPAPVSRRSAGRAA